MPQTLCLAAGVVTVVDECLASEILSHRWSYDGRYIYRTIGRKKLYLHRLIGQALMDLQPDQEIHHVGSRLDNRTANLRVLTCAEHARLHALSSGPRGGTGYKGVRSKGNRFQAYIMANGPQRHLGTFDTAQEAAAAYNQALLRHYPDHQGLYLNRVEVA